MRGSVLKFEKLLDLNRINDSFNKLYTKAEKENREPTQEEIDSWMAGWATTAILPKNK